MQQYEIRLHAPYRTLARSNKQYQKPNIIRRLIIADAHFTVRHNAAISAFSHAAYRIERAVQPDDVHCQITVELAYNQSITADVRTTGNNFISFRFLISRM